MGCINALRREGTREPWRRGAMGCCGLSRQPQARGGQTVGEDRPTSLPSSSAVVTGSAGLHWTDAKHRVLLFFHGDESLEHVHRDPGACLVVATLSPNLNCLANPADNQGILAPWGCGRQHALLAPRLPGACSRVRQSLHYDLLQEYFSTYFPFPQHDQVVILFPSPAASAEDITCVLLPSRLVHCRSAHLGPLWRYICRVS